VSLFLYEDAITLYNLCKGTDYIVGFDINKLHESCGDKYFHQLEYEKAVGHYIRATLDFIIVMKHFLSLIPSVFHEWITSLALPNMVRYDDGYDDDDTDGDDGYHDTDDGYDDSDGYDETDDGYDND